MTSYRLKGTSGAVLNQTFRLSDRLVIGRADDCDICIDHEGMAAHQAEVVLTSEGKVRVRDLGSGSGIRVNGEKIIESAFAGGDELQVGNCRLMLQAPGLRPERVLAGTAMRPPIVHWPWLIALATGAGAVLAWENGYFNWLVGFFGC